MRDAVVFFLVVSPLALLGAALWVFAEKVQRIGITMMGKAPRFARLVEYVGSRQNLRNIRFASALIVAFAMTLLLLWKGARWRA